MAPGQLASLPRRPRMSRIAVLLTLLVLFVTMARVGFFEAERWDHAGRNLRIILGDFWPPNLDRQLLRDLGDSLLETVEMAYAGTLLGAVIALPLSVLAARNLAGRYVSSVARVILAIARTIPALVWALLFIIMVGLGPLPGVLGLAFYTVGYLGKLYYEAFEGVDPEVMEAVRSTGASTPQLVRHAVLPESANILLSQLMFIFEYNVRASSILGFVGAGGIGTDILNFLQFFQYDRLATALLLLLILVLLIDWTSGRLRRRFLLHPHAGVPTV